MKNLKALAITLAFFGFTFAFVTLLINYPLVVGPITLLGLMVLVFSFVRSEMGD